jgi:predicted small lipoprotein YifL
MRIHYLFIVFFCFFLNSCGLKGPLYIPIEKKQEVVSANTKPTEQNAQETRIVLEEKKVRSDEPISENLTVNEYQTEFNEELKKEIDVADAKSKKGSAKNSK